jgi:Holliday junction resolvasome RuvABC endonuclease subunit
MRHCQCLRFGFFEAVSSHAMAAACCAIALLEYVQLREHSCCQVARAVVGVTEHEQQQIQINMLCYKQSTDKVAG